MDRLKPPPAEGAVALDPEKQSCGILFNDGVDQPFDLTGTRFVNLGDDDFKNF